MRTIDLVKKHELKITVACIGLLAAAAGWLLLTRPAHKIEGDFLAREGRREVDAWLLEQLRSDIAQNRARACLALGRIGDEKYLDDLIAALAEGTPSVRAWAAFGIGVMEDRITLGEIGREPQPRAAEALLGALDDGERAVVTNAVEALGKLGWKPAQDHIIHTPAPLPIMLTALVRLEARHMAPQISRLLKSDDQDTRGAGAAALLELGAEIDEGVTRSFLNLTRDVNLWVRMAAVRGLGRAQASREVLGKLTEMTADPDPKVRIEAFRSLGRLVSAEDLAIVVTGLGDRNLNVRIAAVEAMGDIGSARAIPVLKSLRSESSPVSYHAELALSKLAQQESDFFEGLGEAGQAPKPYQDGVAMTWFARALGNYRSPRSAEWLRALWANEAEYAREVRSEVLAALAKQGLEDLAGYFSQALRDPGPHLRETALRLMPQPSLEDWREAFEAAQEPAAPTVRAAALDAAARAAQQAEGKPLAAEWREFFTRALDDSDRSVRRTAVKHLRLLAGEDHDERIGAADPRYAAEDYQRIARTVGRRIRMETSVGEMEIALDYETAGSTAEYFVGLVREGYFNGRRFAQIVRNEALHAGDPAVKQQGPGRPAVLPELNPRPFLRGSLGLEHASQGEARGGLFICLAPQPLLDSRVTNFGRLVSGDDLLDLITEDTRILRMAAE